MATQSETMIMNTIWATFLFFSTDSSLSVVVWSLIYTMIEAMIPMLLSTREHKNPTKYL